MRLVLHPKVYSDIDTIMAYYEQVASAELANEFYGELRHLTKVAAEGQGLSQFGNGVSGG